ncbi:MAG: hypothetical protein ACOC8Q_02550 [Desulfosalsimonas sp.]
MTNQALERAQQSLKIHDVWIRFANAWIADDYDPIYSPLHSPGTQFKHAVARFTLAELTPATADQARQALYLFRVYLDLGMRLVTGQDEDKNFSGKSNQDASVLAKVEATMVAEYHAAEDPGYEALDAVAAKNASYHVWPFWREYLVSQCERMRLPRVFIPTMQLPTEKNKS